MRCRRQNRAPLNFILAALAIMVFFAGVREAEPPAPEEQGGLTASGATGESEGFTISPAPGGTATAPFVVPDIPRLLSVKEPIKVEQTLDKAIITVGDIITYTMTVDAPEGIQIAMPPPGAQLGQFIIRDYEFPDPETEGDRVIHRYIFTITAYSTGSLEVPPMPVFVNPTGQAPRVLMTEGIQIQVAAITNPDDLAIRDVKAPMTIPLDWRPYLIAAAAALLITGAAAAALFYLRRYRPGQVEMPEPVRPAHEVAYRELRELAALKLLEAGEVEAFYTKLSEIIRRYIALRFRIYALEYTSAEILDALKTKALENRVYERTRWFLEETDLVKFARYIPSESARSDMPDRAREIVDWSREEELDLIAAEKPGPSQGLSREEGMHAP